MPWANLLIKQIWRLLLIGFPGKHPKQNPSIINPPPRRPSSMPPPPETKDRLHLVLCREGRDQRVPGMAAGGSEFSTSRAQFKGSQVDEQGKVSLSLYRRHWKTAAYPVSRHSWLGGF